MKHVLLKATVEVMCTLAGATVAFALLNAFLPVPSNSVIVGVIAGATWFVGAGVGFIFAHLVIRCA